MADAMDGDHTQDSCSLIVNEVDHPERDDTHYFAVVCRLLHEGAPPILREIFNHIHPPITLVESLAKPDVFKVLRRLKVIGIIDQDNWALLYPQSKKLATSKAYDVTLLGILLRHVCHLTPPYPNGWDSAPVDSDTSLSADLTRLTCHRQLLANTHSNEDTNISSKDFRKTFDSICTIFKRLHPKKKLDLTGLLAGPLDSRAQKQYIQAVWDWQCREHGISVLETEIDQMVQPSEGKDHAPAQLTGPSITSMIANTEPSHLSPAPAPHLSRSVDPSQAQISGTISQSSKQLTRSVSKRSMRETVPTLTKEGKLVFCDDDKTCVVNLLLLLCAKFQAYSRLPL